jgi:AraC-like DNA-binding protein
MTGRPGRIIRVARLERAKAALADLERGEPIGTIAGRLGFCDASHLTRLFRTRYGMTPRDYRHLIATDAAAQS